MFPFCQEISVLKPKRGGEKKLKRRNVGASSEHDSYERARKTGLAL